MTDCAHNNKSKSFDCATELLAARKEVMRLRTELASKSDVGYPVEMFDSLINGNSPYAFYIFQWVPYQTDAKQWRLKMLHDVKAFDGREECGIWPNGDHCGSFKDSEVEFIRISKKQHGYEWKDPRLETDL